MAAYVLRRLLLMIPTLFGIMVLNFVVINAAPGGPVEQVLAKVKGTDVQATARFGGGAGGEAGGGKPLAPGTSSATAGKYHGAQGIDPEFIRRLEREFGFDKPAHLRFLHMMGKFLRFDFGRSFFRDKSVASLVRERMAVSISLGLWTTLLVHLVSIPLGIAKAVRDGSRFDLWTSALVVVGNAIPGFLFAILLVILFAGGRYLSWFPLRGLVSDDFDALSPLGKVADYLWHMALPVLSMVIGGFAGLTLLTKNSFLEQIHQQYVTTARSKGLSERRILYGHVFRNAMLIVISGFPGALLGILFTGALLTEVIFSLDGLGLLGFEAAINRDYPVMFGTLWFFTLLGLVVKLVEDLTYVAVDPRIDFESRDV
ncbi:microcin C ABC transporter permease YejB [bacterium]|nr:microcin C ABC transporter permease YejB [bacterium]